MLILLNIGGWIIGQRISSKENKRINKRIAENRYQVEFNEYSQEEIQSILKLTNRKRIIAITVGTYIILTFIMATSDFLILMIIQGIIQVIAGIMMLNYTSCCIILERQEGR